MAVTCKLQVADIQLVVIYNLIFLHFGSNVKWHLGNAVCYCEAVLWLPTLLHLSLLPVPPPSLALSLLTHKALNVCSRLLF